MLSRLFCLAAVSAGLVVRFQTLPAPQLPQQTTATTTTSIPPPPPGLLPVQLVSELETGAHARSVSPALLDGGKVFLATRSGEVRAFDAATGTLLWSLGFPGDALFSPVRGSKGIWISREDGLVFLLDPAREEIVASEFVQGAALPPLAAGDAVFFATRRGVVLAYDDTLAHELWRAETPESIRALSVAGDLLMVSGGEHTLTALDAGTGKTRWTFKGRGGFEAPPVFDAARERVYVGDLSGDFYAISTRNGKRRYRWATGGAVTVPALVYRDRVYVTSFANTLFCYAAGPGYELWRVDLPGRPASGPVVAGSRIVVATLTGEIVEFDETGKRSGPAFAAPEEILPSPLIAAPHAALALISGKTLWLATGHPPPPPQTSSTTATPTEDTTITTTSVPVGLLRR